ncbi:MAG: NADH-quinone oxidoreductase subunit [Candidatus Hydrogenedentes bacterium]|nr:NADH-quinone oxidoreductase subunit [Candidatus Hydrogenedentota bacterium]
MNIAFYLAAAVAVASTLLAVAGRNVVHSLLYLVVSLLSVSVVFFVLGAPFIAALEAIVYAGAIMVLFLFVVMMLNTGRDVDDERALLEPGIWRGPAALSAILFIIVAVTILRGNGGALPGQAVEPKQVSLALFDPSYALVVELCSMLLLAGLVGAFHLGRRNGAGKEAK